MYQFLHHQQQCSSLPYSLEPGCLTNRKAPHLARLAGHEPLGSPCLCSPPENIDTQPPQVSLVLLGFELRAHFHSRPSPTEPFPCPLKQCRHSLPEVTACVGYIYFSLHDSSSTETTGSISKWCIHSGYHTSGCYQLSTVASRL